MRTEEIQALLSLLWMLLSDPRILVLFALLLIASVNDWRSYRIPNWLTFGGWLFALLSGVLMARTPSAGAIQALSGLALGFVLLLPCYALGVMGAGDVKLMAMVGAFLGAGRHLSSGAVQLHRRRPRSPGLRHLPPQADAHAGQREDARCRAMAVAHGGHTGPTPAASPSASCLTA